MTDFSGEELGELIDRHLSELEGEYRYSTDVYENEVIISIAYTEDSETPFLREKSDEIADFAGADSYNVRSEVGKESYVITISNETG